jgi:two-component system cell cycle sensor histidine kinase/response regulator CckA
MTRSDPGPLRVVIVEDDAGDAELVQRELVRSGWAIDVRVAGDREAFLAALDEFRPQAILSDYALPAFDGLSAIRLARERTPLVPFIIVTGSIDEETAVECMKAGAWDYVLKGRLGRLGPALAAAVERARLSRERAAGQNALAESEARYRLIAENTADVIWTLDLETRHFTYVSPSVERLRGWTAEEVMAQPMEAALTPESLRRVEEALGQGLAALAAGDEPARTGVIEVEQPCKDGRTVATEVVATVLTDASGRVTGVLGVSRDVSERKRAEDASRAADERLLDAMEVAHLTCWEWDLTDDRVSWVGRIDEALGGEPSGEIEGAATVRGLFPGTDLSELIDDRGPGGLQRAAFSKEVRATWPDGSVHWLDVRGACAYDAAGRATRVRGVTMDVTARKLAEEALRASEEKYRLLVESANEAIVVVRDGVLRFANCRAADLTGYSQAELIGMDVGRLIHPEDQKLVVERYLEHQGAVATPEPYSFRVITRDGAVRWAEVSGVRVVWDDRPATLNFIADVTEAREAEAHARRLAAAVDQAAEVVVITDPDGSIVYANPAFEQVTGYTCAEAIGKNPRILNSGRHSREFYHDMWETLRRGESWIGHFINRRKDGTLFEEDATISPVRDHTGAVAYFVAVKRDVTHELALRAQLEHAQKMEAVGRLAGGVAHDFNNVLQAMLSHISLLRARVADEKAMASAEELGELVRRGAALTRQLLLFSRRETAKIERLDLGGAVRDAMGMLRRLVRENVRFELDLAERPLPIEADRGQIDQVLMNLLVNASDAMPKGGLVVVSTAAEGENVVLRVADDGPGVPETLRSRIFEPFFTTKSTGTGTGLGLAVVHGIVAQHGGTIEVTETPGGGATFVVRLPRAASGEVPALVDDAASAIDIPSGRGERVLVVEDEEGARIALVQILAALGYDSAGAASAEEALALSEGPGFDLLLSDLMLPGATGPELVRSLEERWPHLRVILMSGYTEDEVVRRDVRSGHLRFLQKPFDSITLAREVRATLDATDGDAGSSPGDVPRRS